MASAPRARAQVALVRTPPNRACAGLKGVKLAKCKLGVAHTKTIAECRASSAPAAGQVLKAADTAYRHALTKLDKPARHKKK